MAECRENCGECCSNLLPVDDFEIKKIKQVIVRKGITPGCDDQGFCPFLDENKRCKIYMYRPEICKAFFCGEHIQHFSHGSKRIISFWDEFFPELGNGKGAVEAERLDRQYQVRKEGVV